MTRNDATAKRLRMGELHVRSIARRRRIARSNSTAQGSVARGSGTDGASYERSEARACVPVPVPDADASSSRARSSRHVASCCLPLRHAKRLTARVVRDGINGVEFARAFELTFLR